jgi:hypothetical protein
MTTGLTPQTFENLQLNAGVFLKDFDHSEIDSPDALADAVIAALESREGVLGATRGGGTFTCAPSIRNIEADGKRSEFVGSTVNDGWTVRLSTTLLEATPENFKDALMTADVTTTGNVTKVQPRTAIKKEDYISHLCWIGDTAKGLMLIELDNALNIDGASFTFTDKGEGTLPVNFMAHQSNMLNQEEAPCRVLFFNEAA